MYNFDNVASLGESAGVNVKDLSQYANNGTVSGATWTGNGRRGGAYFFNTNQLISTPLTGTFNDFSVSVWFKDDGVVQTYERIIDKYYAGGFWLGRNAGVSNSR